MDIPLRKDTEHEDIFVSCECSTKGNHCKGRVLVTSRQNNDLEDVSQPLYLANLVLLNGPMNKLAIMAEM